MVTADVDVVIATERVKHAVRALEKVGFIPNLKPASTRHRFVSLDYEFNALNWALVKADVWRGAKKAIADSSPRYPTNDRSFTAESLASCVGAIAPICSRVKIASCAVCNDANAVRLNAGI